MTGLIKDGLKFLSSSRSTASGVLRLVGRGEHTKPVASETAAGKARKEAALQTGSEDFTFLRGNQDFKLLSEIDSKRLEQVCHKAWFAENDSQMYSYLEEAKVLPNKLPIRGALLNGMMFINLACQAEQLEMATGEILHGPAKYITFFVAPDLPFTYLSKEAMGSLAHDLKFWIPDKQEIQFYPTQLGIETAYLSPPSSSFSGANILGSNVLLRSKLGLYVDYGKDYFKIFETA